MQHGRPSIKCINFFTEIRRIAIDPPSRIFTAIRPANGFFFGGYSASRPSTDDRRFAANSVKNSCRSVSGMRCYESDDIYVRSTDLSIDQLLLASALARYSETVVLTPNAGGRSTRFDSCRYVIIFIRATVIDHVVVRRAR